MATEQPIANLIASELRDPIGSAAEKELLVAAEVRDAPDSVASGRVLASLQS
jgi:hypothetical protein